MSNARYNGRGKVDEPSTQVPGHVNSLIERLKSGSQCPTTDDLADAISLVTQMQKEVTLIRKGKNPYVNQGALAACHEAILVLDRAYHRRNLGKEAADYLGGLRETYSVYAEYAGRQGHLMPGHAQAIHLNKLRQKKLLVG